MLHRSATPTSRAQRVAILTGTASLAAVTCSSALALRLHVDGPKSNSTDTRQAQGDASRQVKVEPGIAAAQLLYNKVPVYPAEAKKAKISGAVVLHAIIGKDGQVRSLSVISGPEELQASALDAVRQWVYKPYLLNGDPVAVETTITVHYSFDR